MNYVYLEIYLIKGKSLCVKILMELILIEYFMNVITILNINFLLKLSDFYLSIVILILFIALIIIYYNNYLIRKKQKPFNVPPILPEALFPNDSNIKNDYQKMRNDDNYNYNGMARYYNI